MSESKDLQNLGESKLTTPDYFSVLPPEILCMVIDHLNPSVTKMLFKAFNNQHLSVFTRKGEYCKICPNEICKGGLKHIYDEKLKAYHVLRVKFYSDKIKSSIHSKYFYRLKFGLVESIESEYGTWGEYFVNGKRVSAFGNLVYSSGSTTIPITHNYSTHFLGTEIEIEGKGKWLYVEKGATSAKRRDGSYSSDVILSWNDFQISSESMY